MNGTPSQMLVTIAVNSAVHRWSNQATGSRPTLVSSALISPNSLVEHEPPGEGADERRHRPRQDQQHPVEPAPAQRPVEQHRQAQAEAVVEDDAGDRPDDA